MDILVELTSDDFDNDDNSVIRTSGKTYTVLDSTPTGTDFTTTATLEGLVSTGDGDDQIVVVTSYRVERDTAPDQEEEPADPVFLRFFGLYVLEDLSTSLEQPLPVDAELDTTDDDLLIGIATLEQEPELADVRSSVYGLGNFGTFVSTGTGNDIILGAALATYAYGGSGILINTINTGSGADIIVGAAQNVVEAGVDAARIDGISSLLIDLGSGDDVLAGAASAVLEEFSDIGVRGLVTKGLNLDLPLPTESNADAAPGDTIVIGAANAMSLDYGTDTPDLAESVSARVVGITSSGILGGNGNDVIVGIAFAQLGDIADVGEAIGIIGNRVTLGEGANVLAGIASVDVGANSNIDTALGLTFEEVDGGGAADLILGASFVTMGAGSTVNELVAGIAATDAPDAGQNIETAGGNDVVIGIADVTSGDADTEGNAIGIYAISANTGAGQDTVIGIGGSNSTGEGTGSYGIYDPETHGSGALQLIDLGAEDDFIFARGADGGVHQANILGNDGNDVFDLHSGTGYVDGGADTDTLILSGDLGDFGFSDIPSCDRDDPALYAEIFNGDTDTELKVNRIEFFQFDDQIVAYGDLPFFA